MEDLKKAQTNYCFGGCFRNLDGEIIFKVEKWIDNHRSRGGIWGIWRVFEISHPNCNCNHAIHPIYPNLGYYEKKTYPKSNKRLLSLLLYD